MCLTVTESQVKPQCHLPWLTAALLGWTSRVLSIYHIGRTSGHSWHGLQLGLQSCCVPSWVENLALQSVPFASQPWLCAPFEVLYQLLSINKAWPVPSKCWDEGHGSFMGYCKRRTMLGKGLGFIFLPQPDLCSSLPWFHLSSSACPLLIPTFTLVWNTCEAPERRIKAATWQTLSCFPLIRRKKKREFGSEPNSLHQFRFCLSRGNARNLPRGQH